MGRHFYIILQGEVYVLIRKKQSQQPPPKALGEQAQQVDPVVLQQQLLEQHKNAPEDVFLSQCFPAFQCINILRTGQSFGEIALRQTTPRTATIASRVDCHFAIVSKDTFNDCVAAFYEKTRDLEVKFLGSF